MCRDGVKLPGGRAGGRHDAILRVVERGTRSWSRRGITMAWGSALCACVCDSGWRCVRVGRICVVSAQATLFL